MLDNPVQDACVAMHAAHALDVVGHQGGAALQHAAGHRVDVQVCQEGADEAKVCMAGLAGAEEVGMLLEVLLGEAERD